jgi:DNA-binding NtrC family response regulator
VKTILLIEDEDLVRATVRMILGRAGYNILAAQSAAEADELWRRYLSGIDLVISDNSLPDGSGIALALKFEEEKPGLPVIIASGLNHHELPARFYQLSKPFDARLLLAFVRGALEGK